jgi:hypothetical protein
MKFELLPDIPAIAGVACLQFLDSSLEVMTFCKRYVLLGTQFFQQCKVLLTKTFVFAVWYYSRIILLCGNDSGINIKSVRFSTSFWSGIEWVSTIYQYETVLIVTLYCHEFAVFWSDERESSEFSLIAMNIQSNISGSSLEHDPQPLQIEINFFLDFQHRQSSKLFNTLVTCPEGRVGPIFHQDSSSCPQQEKERRLRHHCSRRPAAVTAAASDRGGRLAAAGLSLLWAAFSPGTIAMVASGVKHSWSPTHVCASN